jgi:hypothetical protein
MSQLPFITSEELDASTCAVMDAIGGNAAAIQDVIDNAILAATDLMWRLTGRQFGVSTDTVRPVLHGGVVYRLELGEYPIISVTSVKVDGETLPTSAYWISEDRFIERVDGTAWPRTQKPYLADSEEETFSVTFSWGTAPPQAVKSATRRLACEILAMAVGQPTSLSERVRSVTRQGMSLDLLSPTDLLNNNGRTGIFEVDLALVAYNADGHTAMPIVIMTPDDVPGEGGSAGGGSGSAQGPAGTGAPGLSAYELAVEGGYVGDQESWLLSLREGYWTEHLDTTLGAIASSISVTGLAAHKRVRLYLTARSSDTIAQITDLRIRFEADAGSNYGWVQHGGSNTGNVFTTRTDASNNSTYLKAGLVTTSHTAAVRYGMITGQTTYVSGFGQPAYLETESVAQSGGAVADTYMTRHAGTWRNPTVDTSRGTMVLTLGSGSFVAGTRIRVEVAD